MQDYVPYKRRRKGLIIQIKSVIALILFFIFVFMILTCLGVSRKNNKCFDKSSFSFVYVQKTKKMLDETEKDLVKGLGGAGIFYFFKEHHYLIANVYLKLDDAKEVAGGMVDSFENAGVLTIETKRLSRLLQQKIKSNLSYYRFFKYLYEFSEKFEELNLNYISGELSQGKLMSELIEINLEFETIVNEFENENNESVFSDIKTYANMILIHFDNFFDEFYQSTKKQALVCALGVNVALTKVDLFDNLQ